MRRALATLGVCATLAGVIAGATASTRATGRQSFGSNARPVVVVAFGGDVSLARGVERAARASSWAAIAEPAARELLDADLAIVNLESPLAPCLPGGTIAHPRLCGPRDGVEALRAMGVDAVTVANNHALDAGYEGLGATVTDLESQGIRVIGHAAATRGQSVPLRIGPIVMIAGDTTTSFHEPGRSLLPTSPAHIADAIRVARRFHRSAPVVVSIHTAREGIAWPSPADEHLARTAVAAGASAVVFHGAHVIREMRIERGVPIHFGLGNLLFDQRAPESRLGEVLTLRLMPGRRTLAVHAVSRVVARAGAAPSSEGTDE